MLFLSTTALLVSPFISSTLAHYTLSQDYSGKAFFDGFDFFTEADPTEGHVKYIDKEDANNSGLAGLMTGGFANNAVYLGVDAVNEALEGRRSIRVESWEAFNRGLIIADIAHMPGGSGCSAWPAFWMVGPDWPKGGEIDIIEGVNEQTSNKMTLHTGPGVSLSDSKAFSGDLVTPNCDINAPGQKKNEGCGISDPDNNTYGHGLNQNGGGVYATEWTSEDIKIWFFPRNAIPANVNSGNPEPSEAWGPPKAAFAGDFQVDDHFKDLKIVFDTTFCGQWAGKEWANSTCATLAPTCEEFVTKNPAAFRESFWAINSLKVFQNEDSPKLRTRYRGAILPPAP